MRNNLRGKEKLIEINIFVMPIIEILFAHLSKKIIIYIPRYQLYYRNLVLLKAIINRSYEYNILFMGRIINPMP